MKQEFEFNISAIVTSDLDLNSSRSLQQVSQDIMDEVSSDLQVFQKVSEPLMYGCLLLLAFSFLRSARFTVFGHGVSLRALAERAFMSVQSGAVQAKVSP